jgi:HPt (histidine-containing phosphotransfer) domain-containing protein
MAKKPEKPAVTTYADHEVIVPPNKLRQFAKNAAPGDTDDPVARAEAALAELSSEFSVWMDTECERLDEARRGVQKAGFNAKTREALFHAAHDIKGEAATFGYPMVANVADSLCRLIEHTPDMKRIPLKLIDQHVDAVKAIIREHAAPSAEAVATKLTTGLRNVTDDFLRTENKDRLDEMEGILSPPLAPTDGGN